MRVRRGDVTAPGLDAVERLTREADLEIIPLRGVDEKLAVVPTGTRLTVTASPRFGLGRTLDYSERAAAAGYRVVPHLAARQIRDRAELAGIVERLGDAGISDLFVIAGDSPSPAGRYDSAIEVLEDLREISDAIGSVGVACYPEGHPSITEERLLEVLLRKSAFADYMVSQLCFNAGAFVRWLTRVRAAGVDLPLHVGLSAPMQVRRLAELSLRLGAASSARYLAKQHGLFGHLLRGSTYEPERFLYEISAELANPVQRVEGLHLFSFNQIAATVEWQRRVSAGPR